MASRTSQTLRCLRRYESRNLVFCEPDGSWPVVWERARGVHVWDIEGRRYLDLTAAFGVAAAGHANPQVVRAGQNQMARLLHAMGDVHPHARKAELARVLSRITFERWTPPRTRPSSSSTSRAGDPHRFLSATAKTIFCNSGFEAVEAALKTAILASGKRGVVAFTGAYHGLGYGALNATHRSEFRSPFQTQLGRFSHFVPFPVPEPDRAGAARSPRATLAAVDRELSGLFRRRPIGAVLVEPVQGRGGIRVPPPEFLPLLRTVCDREGALLILDEIYTGLGRTGRWFACEHSGVVPDLVCLGKGLTGGFPLSACVGKADLMDAAWPASSGEAIHTSTFLGHPVGCAMALAQIREIAARNLVRHARELGAWFLQRLASFARERPGLALQPRGIGLMAGLEFRPRDGSAPALAVQGVVRAMLRRGFILLPEGERGEVLSFTPPLTITRRQLQSTLDMLAAVLDERFGR